MGREKRRNRRKGDHSIDDESGDNSSTPSSLDEDSGDISYNRKARKSKRENRSKKKKKKKSTKPEERRSVISGKKIKLHIDKSEEDLAQDEARKNLLEFMNSSVR